VFNPLAGPSPNCCAVFVHIEHCACTLIVNKVQHITSIKIINLLFITALFSTKLHKKSIGCSVIYTCNWVLYFAQQMQIFKQIFYMKTLFFSISLLFVIVANAQQTAAEWVEEGKKLKTDKKYTDAVAAFKTALAKDNNSFDAHYELGWCYNELQKYTDALTSLKRADQLLPGMAKVYFETAWAYEKSGKKEEAINFYRRTIQIKKDYSSALYRKGFLENNLTLYDSALATLSSAVYYKSENAEAWSELGFAQYKLNDEAAARSSFRKCISLDPKKTSGYTGMGDVFKTLTKNYDSALYYYQQSAAINPQNLKAVYNIGWCYNSKGLYDEAVKSLQKALTIDNDYEPANSEIGYSYYGKREYSTAFLYFDKSISLKPKTIIARYYKGLCYVEQKNKTAAQKMYDELKQLDETNATKLLKQINEMK
jgi:tetratricopeptide (TPR) repeat protein